MRIEHDLIGDYELPAASLWGVHTARAVDNFPISGVPIGHYRNLIRALGLTKAAAARVNAAIGGLDKEKAKFLELACMEVAEGKLDKYFVVDAIPGGAGTSTNMNTNEVIANRALELMGKSPGDYQIIHPLNDVNRSQSTNDFYPTALRLALIFEIELLDQSLTDLKKSYEAKAKEFADILKMGRTRPCLAGGSQCRELSESRHYPASALGTAHKHRPRCSGDRGRSSRHATKAVRGK